MSHPHQNKFGITDNGDFIEYVYHQNESSFIYGKLIGRRPVLSPAQKSFTSADIVMEGYLKKEGSWRKSWKTRYFILRKDIRTLCIFVSKDALTLIGSIPLNKNVIVFSDQSQRTMSEDRFNTFSIRMGKSEEDIVLCAPDEESKAKWMDAIIKESTRTEESIAPDWWRDTFGQVPIMDSKAIAELIEQRRAEERERRLAALKADGIGGAAVDGAGGPGIPAYSSSDPAIDVLAHGIESRLDMDPHTAKAENARLSLALASFGGLPPNVSSEALFMDRDSDDELDDEDDDDAATIDGTPRSKKRSTSSLTGRRAGLNGGAAPLDSDEEIETTKKKDKINALLARAKKSETKESKSKAFHEPPLQPATAHRHMTEYGFTGIKLSVKIENLSQHQDRLFMVIFKGHISVDKKSDPKTAGAGSKSFLSWTPLSRTEEVVVDERSDYSDTVLPSVTKQFSLLQGPVETEAASHLMFVLFKNEHNEGAAAGGNDYDFESQVVLGKLVVKRELLYTSSGILKFDMNVLDDRSLDLSLSQWSIPKITVGIIIVSSPEIASYRNRMIRKFPFQPYAEVGYSFRSSKGQGLAMEQLFVSPYGLMVTHSLLSLLLPERHRQVSDAILIARDDLQNTNSDLQELTALALREFLNSMEIRGKSHDLMLAQPASYPQFSPITRENQSMSAIGERAAALERLVSTLEAISKLIAAYYGSAHKNISNLVSGGVLRNSVLAKTSGGSFMRRSVWKKSPSWQFSSINLNVHLMYSQSFPLSSLRANEKGQFSSPQRLNIPMSTDSDVVDEAVAPLRSLSRETPEAEDEGNIGTAAQYNPSGVDIFPSLTFGAFAAHALGFEEGGIRRLFSKIKPDDVKLEWMVALQASGGVKYSAIGPLIKHYPEHADALFNISANGEDPAEILSKAFLLCLRIDICIGQALGQAVTSIKTLLKLASLGVPGYEEKLKIFLIAGFFLPIESLLSSQGHEMGMLEDLDGILPLLNSIVFRLVTENVNCVQDHGYGAEEMLFHLGTNIPGICVRRDIAGRLVVDILVTKREEEVLRGAFETVMGYQEWSTSSAFRFERACPITDSPQCVYKPGCAVPDVVACAQVFAVVFTQGVNERQTLANMSGESYKQVEINVDAGMNVEVYSKRYIDVLQYFQQLVLINMQFSSSPEENVTTTRSFKVLPSKVSKTATASSDTTHSKKADDVGGHELDVYDHKIKSITEMLNDLSATIRASKDNLSEKNVNVLLKASRLSRQISGNMSILCKSGKDRTSMCVTLEEARQLVEGEIDAVGGQEIARVLRRHGVRRMNVWANTGQPMYAFNGIQCQLLPQCFRPPPGTFSGNVQT